MGLDKWMTTPLGNHCDLGFGALGNAYLEGAQVIRKATGEGSFFWAYLPECYLLRHAIELFLKSGIIIMHRSLKLPYGSEPHSSITPKMPLPKGKWKSLFDTHNIPELYAYWRSLIVQNKKKLEALAGYPTDMSILGELDGWIKTIGRKDLSSDYFRYPVNKKGDSDKEKSPAINEVSLESWLVAEDSGKKVGTTILIQGVQSEPVRVFSQDKAPNKDIAEAVRNAAEMLNNFHAMMRNPRLTG